MLEWDGLGGVLPVIYRTSVHSNMLQPQMAGPDDLSRSLPAPFILWFFIFALYLSQGLTSEPLGSGRKEAKQKIWGFVWQNQLNTMGGGIVFLIWEILISKDIVQWLVLKVIAHNRQAIKSLGGYRKSPLILQARLLQLGRGHACPGPLFLVHTVYSQATVQAVLLEIAISVKELLNNSGPRNS